MESASDPTHVDQDQADATQDSKPQVSPSKKHKPLAMVALIMLVSMTLYEGIKQFLLPSMSIWASHTLTIIFTAIGATAIAYFVLRARDSLIHRLTTEAAASARIQHELTQQLHFTQVLADAVPSPLFVKNQFGVYIGCNTAFEHFFSRTRAEILGKTSFDLVPEKAAQAIQHSDQELLQTGIVQRNETEALHGDGSVRQVIYHKAVFRGKGGTPKGLVGIVIDITELKQAEQTILRQKNFLEALIDNLPLGVFTKDARNGYRFSLMNTRAEQEFGLKREDMIGKNDFDFFAQSEAEFFRSIDEKVMREKKVIDIACETVTTAKGEIQAHTIKVPLTGMDGEPDTLLGILENITERKKTEDMLTLYRTQLETLVAERTGDLEQSNERLREEVLQRQEGERRIEYLAYHDTLTELPNRTLLRDRIAQAVEASTRNSWHVAVLTVDLDQFKNVNDSLGHATGDKLLRAVSERLRQLVRKEDTVARVGGDEFVVLLPNLKSAQNAARVAEKILADTVRPYLIDHQTLHVTASIGISICPENGNGGLALIRCADTAMYQAKAAGRNCFAFFNPEMTNRAMETLRIGNELRRAIDQQEFVLHYQPQIDLASGRIIGAEALVRWQHPQDGLIFPGKFIRIAEETGLIQAIGEWVLRIACDQNQAWQMAGLPPIVMAVNLSARQFNRKHIEHLTMSVLTASGLPPRYLELEITEGMVMQNAEEAIAVMQMLKSIGVMLSIDDFGTGYSSLSYLKRFPLDKLKIDQSFVRDLGEDPDDAAIVTTIIGLAKSLGLHVIAEGVEKKEQLEFLRAQGCDEVQGYFFSRPIPATDFEKLLRSESERT